MTRNKRLAVIVICLMAVAINLFILFCVSPEYHISKGTFNFSFESDTDNVIQIFYKDDEKFVEEKSNTISYSNVNTVSDFETEIDSDTKYIRIDFGNRENTSYVNNMSITIEGKTISLDSAKLLQPDYSNMINSVSEENGRMKVVSRGDDPWLAYSVEDLDIDLIAQNEQLKKFHCIQVILCIAVVVLGLFSIFNIDTIVIVPYEIMKDIVLFRDLVKNDFQARFAGNYLGAIWAFIQPFITMALYWFVFQVGLRAQNVSDYPFILYLMSGMIPWFYFSETVASATNSLFEYSYLVKKVVFNVRMLPVLKIVSALFVHLFFVAFIMFICVVYGYMPDLYWLQIAYYIVCMMVLVLGLTYITSSCAAFFKDTMQIVNVILTVGVWITPIMWNPANTMSERLLIIFKLNPFYYIVDGFRDALLTDQWFWEKPEWTIYYWGVCIGIYVFGLKLFDRLKIHFSDVL